MRTILLRSQGTSIGENIAHIRALALYSMVDKSSDMLGSGPTRKQEF